MHETDESFRVCEGLMSSEIRDFTPAERSWMASREARLRSWCWRFPVSVSVAFILILVALVVGASTTSQASVFFVIVTIVAATALVLVARDRWDSWKRANLALGSQVELFVRDDGKFYAEEWVHSSSCIERIVATGEVISRDGLSLEWPEFSPVVEMAHVTEQSTGLGVRQLHERELQELRTLARFPKGALWGLFLIPYGALALSALLAGKTQGITTVLAVLAVLLGLVSLVTVPLELRLWLRLRRDLEAGSVQVDGTDEWLPNAQRWWRESGRPTSWRSHT